MFAPWSQLNKDNKRTYAVLIRNVINQLLYEICERDQLGGMFFMTKQITNKLAIHLEQMSQIMMIC